MHRSFVSIRRAPRARGWLLAAAALGAAPALSAAASAPQQIQGEPLPGADHLVFAFAEYETDDGPALVAAGAFRAFGGTLAHGIALRIGGEWTSPGGGLAMEPPDPLGIPPWAHALCVHDDGSGTALFATGRFTHAGGVAANSIARWDGVRWSPLGAGLQWQQPLTPGLAVGEGVALLSFDDGSGPALYVTGVFTHAGGVERPMVARWSRGTWSQPGEGQSPAPWQGQTSPPGQALAAFDFGSGPELVVGGSFVGPAGSGMRRLARWNGANWQDIQGGLTQPSGNLSVQTLLVHRLGETQVLSAGGRFSELGGVEARNVGYFDGNTWHAYPGSLTGPLGGSQGTTPVAAVKKLAIVSEGGRRHLVAAGDFDRADGRPAGGFAVFEGSGWRPGLPAPEGGPAADWRTVFQGAHGEQADIHLGGAQSRVADSFVANHVAVSRAGRFGPLLSGIDGTVRAVTHFVQGGEEHMVAGGDFLRAGEHRAPHVALWDGTHWSPIGAGLPAAVHALEIFDAGQGPLPVAGMHLPTASGGGVFAAVRRWTGSHWEPLGLLPEGRVNALLVHDGGSGPRLHAATAGGSVGHLPRVRAWDGAAWIDLAFPLTGTVHSLASYDEGAGPRLFAGGQFAQTEGIGGIRSLARWHGGTWSAVAPSSFSLGASSAAWSLAVHDDGAGARLFVGGRALTPTSDLAAWDGTTLTAIAPQVSLAEGDGTLRQVRALVGVHGGSGAGLYAGALVDLAGGAARAQLLRWNGAWSDLGAGLIGDVLALGTYVDGGTIRVLAAGSLSSVGELGVARHFVFDSSTTAFAAAGADSRSGAASIVASVPGAGLAPRIPFELPDGGRPVAVEFAPAAGAAFGEGPSGLWIPTARAWARDGEEPLHTLTLVRPQVNLGTTRLRVLWLCDRGLPHWGEPITVEW